MATIMQIYNEKEQAGQGKIQNIKFEKKGGTRKYKQIKVMSYAKCMKTQPAKLLTVKKMFFLK